MLSPTPKIRPGGRHLYCNLPKYFIPVLERIGRGSGGLTVPKILGKALVHIVSEEPKPSTFNYRKHVAPFKKSKIGPYFSESEIAMIFGYQEIFERKNGGLRCMEQDLFCKALWDNVPQIQEAFLDTQLIEKNVRR